MTANVTRRRHNRILMLGLVTIISLTFASGCDLSKVLTTSSVSPVSTPSQPAANPTPFLSNPKPTDTPQQNTPAATTQALNSASDRIVLSIAHAGHEHLYVYHPMYQSLAPLTAGDWDDRDPAVSPDGTKIAFSSNRNDNWNLFLLNLATQKVESLTQSANYDGSPSWSPDGQWIAYETYDGTFFNIVVLPANDPSLPSIQLTQDSGNNFSPAWSPAGREVAFVTDRDGNSEIWTANLDKVDERYQKVAADSNCSYTSPAWSPDGTKLAWTKTCEGVSTIEIAPLVGSINSIGEGSDPVWSPDGSALLAQLAQPNGTYLVGYSADHGLLLFPPHLLPTSIHGVAWHSIDTASLQQDLDLAAKETDGLNNIITDPLRIARKSLVQIVGVTTAYPYLQDGVNESFNALRASAGNKLGWDFLARLDDAVLPISAPPQPGISENWLYTGRAINVDSTPLDANWMTATREDFQGRVYWRLWVRCLKQDGSCGEPQRLPAWDFSARYQGNNQAYEDGGQAGAIPGGYWLDFTDLALSYGWERSASLSNWRAYFQATLFNQFVLRQGVSWQNAMLELYPSEALQGADGSIPLPIKQ